MSKIPMTLPEYLTVQLHSKIEGFEDIFNKIQMLSEGDLLQCRELIKYAIDDHTYFTDFLLFIFGYNKHNDKHFIQKYYIDNDILQTNIKPERDENINVIYKIKCDLILMVIGENEIKKTKHFIYAPIFCPEGHKSKELIYFFINIIDNYNLSYESKREEERTKNRNENLDKFHKMWFE